MTTQKIQRRIHNKMKKALRDKKVVGTIGPYVNLRRNRLSKIIAEETVKQSTAIIPLSTIINSKFFYPCMDYAIYHEFIAMARRQHLSRLLMFLCTNNV